MLHHRIYDWTVGLRSAHISNDFLFFWVVLHFLFFLWLQFFAFVWSSFFISHLHLFCFLLLALILDIPEKNIWKSGNRNPQSYLIAPSISPFKDFASGILPLRTLVSFVLLSSRLQTGQKVRTDTDITFQAERTFRLRKESHKAVSFPQQDQPLNLQPNQHLKM